MVQISYGDMAQATLLRRHTAATKLDITRLSGEATTGVASDSARQVAQAAVPNGDVVPFIAYMVRGFADGAKALLNEVSEAQYRIMAQEELRTMVDPAATVNGERLQALARSLQDQRGKVPTATVTQLSPELALTYARLNAKTLQRDLAQLEELGLVERSRGAVQARTLSVRPFAMDS